MTADKIQQEIIDCREELKKASIEFNMQEDPDMISYSIFKMNALECKHKALINRYKKAKNKIA